MTLDIQDIRKLRWKPFAAILVWLASTYILSFAVGSPEIDDSLGFETDLPEVIGPWEGNEVYYCQNMECGRSVLVKDLPAPSECPYCGSEVGAKSPAEQRVLPHQVLIERKYYEREGQGGVLATLLVGGGGRESIHRPQRCLVAQGSTIISDKVVEIDIPGKSDPLRVMFLHTSNDDSLAKQQKGFLAYWFLGQGRQTPYNYERLFWIAWERLFKHRVSRWAYISISGRRSMLTDDDEYEELSLIVREIARSIYK